MKENELIEEIANTKSNPRIQESELIEVYLPMIFNDPTVGNRWVAEIAITPFTTVDVLDNEGEFLYHIPPMRLVGDTIMTNEYNLITSYVAELGRTNPIAADRYFAKAISGVGIASPKRNPEADMFWSKLIRKHLDTSSLPKESVSFGKKMKKWE